MAKILVYNPQTAQMERYDRGAADPMPYITGKTLTVGEFSGSSGSPTLWTDRRTMEAWNEFRGQWGQPIYVGYAFKRIWQGGHAAQSQHYAGIAFDIAQNLDNSQRAKMRTLALDTGVWRYVEPAVLTPTWVHVDAGLGTPACIAGYPALQKGMLGVYVLVLQDALNALGYPTGGLDGIFGSKTEASVRQFQSDFGLYVDGYVGCLTWLGITNRANGVGFTDTVI